MSARVAELTGRRQFRLGQIEAQDPGPGEVQVRVQAVGICGSDMHSYAGGGIGNTRCIYPMVLGHEPAGVIAKMGAGVSGWQTGDLVACEPALYCYHCEFCMAGRHNVCSRLRFLSTPEEPGFFRDYVNLPVANVLGLPAHVDASQGSLIEPLAVALHSMEFARPKPGETVAVYGAGPIGLLTLAVLKLSGVGRIWAVEPVAARRAFALRMGADAVIDPWQVDAARQILDETGKRGVDLVIDCAAKPESVQQTIQVARNAGRVVFTGIPSELETPIEFHSWRRKELALYQVRRSNHEGSMARDLIAEHTKWFAPLITHTRPLEQIAGAFELVERYEDGVGKLVMRLDE